MPLAVDWGRRKVTLTPKIEGVIEASMVLLAFTRDVTP